MMNSGSAIFLEKDSVLEMASDGKPALDPGPDIASAATAFVAILSSRDKRLFSTTIFAQNKKHARKRTTWAAESNRAC